MFFPLSLLSWKPRQLVNGKHVEDKLEFFTLWYWWTPVVRKGVFLLTQKLSVALPLTQKALICGAKGYEWWCKRHWKVVSETVCRGRMVAVKSSYGSSRKFVWQLRVFSVPEMVAVRWFIAHVLPVVVVVSVVVKITSTCLLAAFHRQAILESNKCLNFQKNILTFVHDDTAVLAVLFHSMFRNSARRFFSAISFS